MAGRQSVAVFLGASALAAVLSAGREPRSTETEAAAIERGRYITHDLAMCVQCHSPRNESGEIRKSEEFRGAPIPVLSPFPGKPWAVRAPNLRGLEGFSDGAILRLLVEGVAHRGAPPQSPMPPFRMTSKDAKAVLAYLRSLR